MTSCPDCAGPAHDDQRYCLNCGARLAGAPELVTEAPPVGVSPQTQNAPEGSVPLGARRRLPGPPATGSTALGVLASGILMGVGIGPVALGSGGPARATVLLPAPAAAAPVTGAFAAKDLAPALSAPLGSTEPAAPSTDAAPTVDSGGDGGSSVAPSTDTAPASPAPSPAPSTPTTTTPAAPTTNFTGTVVHLNEAAGSFTLAGDDGKPHVIHVPELPKLGQFAQVAARSLANGTWSADDVASAPGSSPDVRLRGTVTALDPAGGRYVLSARGVSLLVALPAAPPDGTPAPAPPALGDAVDVKATLEDAPKPAPDAAGTGTSTTTADDPDAIPAPDPPAKVLRETNRTGTEVTVPSVPPPEELEAIVEKVDAKTRDVRVTADDRGELAARLDLQAAPKLRLARIAPHETLVLRATRAADGRLTLVAFAADTGPDAADDPANADGSLSAKAAVKKQ